MGEWKGWYATGQLMYQKFYRDGKEEGEWKEWCSNGQLLDQEFYRDGKREGGQGWGLNGVLVYQDDIIKEKIAGQNTIRRAWRNHKRRKMKLLVKR